MNESPRPDTRVLRVFLSSPGDVRSERKTVLHAIEELNREPGLSDRVLFRFVAWDAPELVRWSRPWPRRKRSIGRCRCRPSATWSS